MAKVGGARAAGRGNGPWGGWLLPGLCAVGAGVAMTLAAGAVRVPAAAGDQARATGVPSLAVTRLDWLPVGGEVRERLRLLDPSPLLMPGDFDDRGGVASAVGIERPGGGVTEVFPPALAFSESRPSKEILRPPIPRTAEAAIDLVVASRWFDGMARADEPTAAASVGIGSAGRIDVHAESGSALVATLPLPEDPALDAVAWRPVELSVLINAAGTVASPMVISGSGVAEVDERLRVLAQRELLPRLRLRPGAYRLVVGP
jgi:hypothetical protein